MESQIAQEEAEIGRLRGLSAQDPAGPAIASFAEAHRRAGDPDKALALADQGLASQPDLVAARIAKALALLDLMRAEDARAELEEVLRLVGDHPVAQTLLDESFTASTPEAGSDELGSFNEAELDDAFRGAEPLRDEMVSANDFAEAALHTIDDEPDPEAEPFLPFRPASDSPYATATVADLLDEQGHVDDARDLRQDLHLSSAPPESRFEASGEGRILTTLERWLDNLRRRTG